jgi:hypothetical protein
VVADDAAKLLQLKGLLRARAPAMAAALDGAQAGQAVSLLGSTLLSNQDAGLDLVISAVGQEGNEGKVAAAEAHWVKFPPGHIVSQAEHDETTTKDRLVQAAQQNDTAIRLAYITTAGFFILVFSLIVVDQFGGKTDPGPYRDILLTMLGVIGTSWAGIVSFFFGSSVGSRQQSQTLQDISRGATGAHGNAGGGNTTR